MEFLLYVLCATQIIVESLPISSSTHLELMQQWLGVRLPEFFDHFAHGPTMIIILLTFWDAWLVPMRMFLRVVLGWLRRRCAFSALSYSHRRLLILFGRITGFVVLADGVTAVFYVAFGHWIKQPQQVPSDVMLLFGLMVTAGLLFSLRWCNNRSWFDTTACGGHSPRAEHDDLCVDPAHPECGAKRRVSKGTAVPLTNTKALLIGVVQGLAQMPGISRFASTFVMARWLGISPRRSLQFSFLMFFPLIVAAFFINGLPAVVLHPEGRALFTLPFGLVLMAASIVAYVLFKIVCRWALDGRMWWFGFYMLLPIVAMVCRLIGII